MTATLTVNTLVEHPVWGRGKVTELCPPYFKAYFPSLVASAGGPQRKLQLTTPLISLSPVKSDPNLDQIKLPKKGGTRKPKQTKPLKPTLHSLEQAIGWFSQTYPGHFKNQELIERELGYKRDAHRMFVGLFGGGRGEALIDAGRRSAIAKGLDELYHATNIPARFEIMAVHDGLKDGQAAVRLLRALLDFVAVGDAGSFGHLADSVAALPAPADGSTVLTWPTVTILPFLAAPRKFMVLKPALTKRMARRLGFDLMYSTPPTWHTYEALLEMSHILLDRLAPLGAKDFIDVQSFMWVTQELE